METKNIRQYLSRAFADAIGNEEAEADDMYMFLVYIHFGAVKAIYPTVKKARKGATAIRSYMNKYANEQVKDQNPTYDDEDVKLLFENNKDVIQEIIEDIWNAEAYNDELKWLETWITNCRSMFKAEGFNTAFMYLNKEAYEVAGFSNKSLPHLPPLLILDYFIELSKRSLSHHKFMRIA